MSLNRLLGPFVFLVRNPGKTAPVVAVIVLAVTLIAGIVAIMDSIPLSIRTIYGYSKQYAGITPRGDASLTPQLLEMIEEESPVETERVIVCRAASAEVQSIVGPWPFVVLGFEQKDLSYYLDRMGARNLRGRLPAPGQPEAIISESVSKNLKLKLGDTLLGPEEEEAYSPREVEIVGIVESESWLMLAPIDYIRDNHFPPVDILLVFAKDQADQEIFDDWTIEALEPLGARSFVYKRLDSETDAMFAILYTILNVVIGLLVVVITVMMGMLMNIYQSQRAQETGLLQAIGYSRRFLIGRAMLESAVLVCVGWLVGVVFAILLLLLVKARLMDPNAFALDPVPLDAFLYTLPVPVAIFLASAFNVFMRLRKYDPVGIVERRLA